MKNMISLAHLTNKTFFENSGRHAFDKRMYFTGRRISSHFDCFEKNDENNDCLPRIIVKGNISSGFKDNVRRKMQNIPSKWLKEFQDNGYSVVLVDSIKKALNSNPSKTTLALTCENKNSSGVVYFSDKINEDDLQKTINHEMGHVICNTKKLYSDPNILQALIEDIADISQQKKLDGLTQEERMLLSKYFFNKKAHLPIDEIIADLFAWNLPGGGCYGSNLTLKKENSQLMKDLFPRLNQKIASQ